MLPARTESADTDLALARRISECLEKASPDLTEVELVIESLAGMANPARSVLLVVRLLRHPDPRVRSKAALLLVRANPNRHTLETLLGDPDPRVRANVVEALWDQASPRVAAVLWKAARDPHHRVAGNALLALHRMGEAGAAPVITSMAAHDDPHFRATAAWVMGQTGDQRFMPVLAKMVQESDPNARGSVFRAVRLLKTRAEPGPAQGQSM
jgi:HEAT repeat protein